MPSPRRDRETAPAAASWSVESRPADAMPDFGDRYLPGYETRERNTRRRDTRTRPRARRNGLPEQRLYITDEIRDYYAAQGRTLPPGRAYYGTGRDTLTGHLTGAELQQQQGGQ